MILIDARNGIVEQSRRHAFLSNLLGIPHWSSASTRWTSSTGIVIGSKRLRKSSWRSPPDSMSETWRSSPFQRCTVTTSSTLRTTPGGTGAGRFSTTSRPCTSPATRTSSIRGSRCSTSSGPMVHGVDFRGYAGTVASGVFRQGDPVVIMPLGVATTIGRSDGGRPVAEAFLPWPSP